MTRDRHLNVHVHTCIHTYIHTYRKGNVTTRDRHLNVALDFGPATFRNYEQLLSKLLNKCMRATIQRIQGNSARELPRNDGGKVAVISLTHELQLNVQRAGAPPQMVDGAISRANLWRNEALSLEQVCVLCICICICICIYMCIWIWICVCICLCICFMCVFYGMYVGVQEGTMCLACVYACTCVCMYVICELRTGLRQSFSHTLYKYCTHRHACKNLSHIHYTHIIHIYMRV